MHQETLSKYALQNSLQLLSQWVLGLLPPLLVEARWQVNGSIRRI
jgi:hypothetical protein